METLERGRECLRAKILVPLAKKGVEGRAREEDMAQSEEEEKVRRKNEQECESKLA